MTRLFVKMTDNRTDIQADIGDTASKPDSKNRTNDKMCEKHVTIENL